MHDGHRDRLRERFLQEGLDRFEPHNILELLLFYGIPRKDTNEIAHVLINKFGSLSGVLDAPIEELKSVEGIGESASVFLKLLPAVSRAYLDDRANGIRVVNDSESAGELLLTKFIGRQVEAFVLLLLDSKGKVLFCDVVTEGSIHSVELNIKKMIALCSKYDAASAIIAHNHPSGVALPSNADLVTTERFRQALELIHVRLTDHLIVADNDYVSLGDTPNLRYLFD